MSDNADNKSNNEELQDENVLTEEKEEKETETLENLEAIIEQMQEDAKKNSDKLLRTMAEYDNFRKRSIKEKSDMYDKGIIDTIGKFLDILDSFNRAIEQFDVDNMSDTEKSMYDGITMLQKQFNQNLIQLGVKEIETTNKEFDPNLHNAVTHIEDDSVGSNMIVEEFQKGYIYNDKVIRYSMVKVAN